MKRALIIGLNYINEPEFKLNECINDAKYAYSKLKHYFNPRDIRIITDYTNGEDRPSRDNIINALDWLSQANVAVLHISAHVINQGGIHAIHLLNREILHSESIFKRLSNVMEVCYVILDTCHASNTLNLEYRVDSEAYFIKVKDIDYPSRIITLNACKKNEKLFENNGITKYVYDSFLQERSWVELLLHNTAGINTLILESDFKFNLDRPIFSRIR